MNNNLEENLSKIKIRQISIEEKDSLWHNIVVRKAKDREVKSNLLSILSISSFNFQMNKLIVGALALVLVLGGGTMVAASNQSLPGDLLFPVDLAIEKIQIKLASEEQRHELKLKFAEERVAEIKHVSEEKSVPAVLVADLSLVAVAQIEAEVFTNETIVKIEAGDKKYGYLSALKTKAELVKEIATKYSLSEEKVNTLIAFSIEDRASRADDKGFLNKTHSVNFSDDESDDVGKALTDLEELLEGNEQDERAQKIEKSLQELLILLGDDGDLEIKKKDGKIKIESDSFKIEIKGEDSSDDSSDDDSNDASDDSDDDSKDDSKSKSIDSSTKVDVKEDASEIFCRGEWRKPTDCQEGDANSGSSVSGGSDDDDDGDEMNDDDEDEDEDEDGEDDSDDDEEDDDNSGKGSDDDKDDDD